MKLTKIKIYAVLMMFSLCLPNIWAQKKSDDWHDHNRVSINTMNGNPDITSGVWFAERGYGGIYIQLTDSKRRINPAFSIQFRAEEDEFRSTGADRYSLERGAGTITFEGGMEGDTGQGSYEFTVNSTFKRFLDSKNITAEDSEKEDYYYLKLFLGYVTQDYTQHVLDLGYDPSLNVLAKLGIHEVSKEYLNYASTTDFKELDLNMIAKFAIHGVSMDYMKGLKSLGYGTIEANDVKKFAIHGVSLDFIKGLKNAGYELEANDIRKFAIHGVTLKYINGLNDLGYGDMDADMIRKFAVHGVSLSYIRGLGDAGYQNLDPDTIRKFAVHGVSPNYIENLLAANIDKPDADLIRKAKVHGVSARFIDRARSKGHESRDLSDYIRWKVRGI